MDLAIVIVSFNVRELLRGCLASVADSLGRTPNLHAGVWVVDNASTDGSTAMVQTEFPGVRLLACNENLGFAAGNNWALRLLGFRPAGAEAARSVSLALPDDPALRPPSAPRYVMLLNPDTVVTADALGQLVGFLDSHPRAGGCGAQLSYPDGRFQHGAFRFPTLAQVYFDFYPPPGRLNRPTLDSRYNGRYSRRLYAQGRPFPVDFVLGATLTLRTTAIEQVGLLDEGYFMYCEEMDWQRRLRLAGWAVACVPTALVVHYGGASTDQFRGPMFVALWRSRLRYFDRYHGPLFNRALATLVRRGVQAEARRARRQNPPDLAQRLAAYAEVAHMAAAQGQRRA